MGERGGKKLCEKKNGTQIERVPLSAPKKKKEKMMTYSFPPPPPRRRRFGVLSLLLLPSLMLLLSAPSATASTPAAGAEAQPPLLNATESLVPLRTAGGAASTATAAATKTLSPSSFRRVLFQYADALPLGTFDQCTAQDLVDGNPCCHPQDTAYC